MNGIGEGAKSSPDLQLIAATAPSAPLNLRKQAASTTSIEIKWDLPATDGYAPILDYEVWWDNAAENNVFTKLTSSTGNLLQFSKSDSLVAGSYYSFKVLAKNIVGNSVYSNTAVVIAALVPS